MSSLAIPPTTSPPRTLSDLNNDVLFEICDHLLFWVSTFSAHGWQHPTPLKNLCLVNRRLYALVGPLVQKSIDICRPTGLAKGNNNGDWGRASRIFKELAQRPTMLFNITSLHFDIYGQYLPDQPAPKENLGSLVGFLTNLPNLRRLAIYLPDWHASDLEVLISGTKINDSIVLPNVRTLVIPPRAGFLIDRCPNVEGISIQHRVWRSLHYTKPTRTRAFRLSSIRESLANASKLIHLEAECLWTSEDIVALMEACPLLQRLHMPAYIPSASLAMASDTELLGNGLKSLRRWEIANVPHVRHMANDLVRDTGLSKRMKENDEEYIARMSFGNIPSLEVLRIGDSSIARKRKTNEVADWKWTR